MYNEHGNSNSTEDNNNLLKIYKRRVMVVWCACQCMHIAIVYTFYTSLLHECNVHLRYLPRRYRRYIDCTIVIGRHHQRRQFDRPRVTLHYQQTFQAQHQAAALSQLCSS